MQIIQSSDKARTHIIMNSEEEARLVCDLVASGIDACSAEGVAAIGKSILSGLEGFRFWPTKTVTLTEATVAIAPLIVGDDEPSEAVEVPAVDAPVAAEEQGEAPTKKKGGRK